jgi:hypothetical protein
LNAAIDKSLSALLEKLRAVLSGLSENDNVMPLGVVDPVPIGILPPLVGGDAEGADCILICGLPELRIFTKVTKQDDFIN